MVSTVPSQQEGPGFSTTESGLCCAEFTCRLPVMQRFPQGTPSVFFYNVFM